LVSNYDLSALNALLGNAMNAALKAARQFYEKCPQIARSGEAEAGQSDRLTASGVMCRGPGAARRPAAV
jgi:hypothetical protein